MSRTRTDCEGFHRRDFLRVGAAGLLGLSLPEALRAEALNAPDPRAKKPATGVIQIWLSGGPATIDMWDLKPDAPEEIRGEFRPIATAAPGVSITEHMPGLAKVMDRCTLVRSLGHTITRPRPGHDLHGHGQPAGRRRWSTPRWGPWRRGCCRRGRASRPTSRSPRCETVPRASGRATSARRTARSRSRASPLEGTLQAHGVSLPSGIHAARPAVPRGLRRPVRPRPAGARVRPRRWRASTASIARRWRSSSPTASAPRSTSRASRPPSATTTAGRRWARGPSRPGG